MLRLRRRAVSDAENVKTFHNSLSEEFRGSLKLKPSTFKKNYKLAFVDFFCSVFFWILEGLAFFVVTLSCFNWFVASPIVKEWQVIWIQTHRHHGEIKKKLFLISKRNLISLQLIICPSIWTFPNFIFNITCILSSSIFVFQQVPSPVWVFLLCPPTGNWRHLDVYYHRKTWMYKLNV